MDFSEIPGIILGAAENSFLQVTVFVGAVLLIFGYVNYKYQGKLVKAIEDAEKIQPVLGALLGLTPGCGGAIFVMPLFFRRTVTFGTVVATLVATMGDSAFVLISISPFHYLSVSAFSFCAGILTGYVTDYFKIGDYILKGISIKNREEAELVNRLLDHTKLQQECGLGCDINTMHIGHSEGDAIDLALHHKARGHEKSGTFMNMVTHGGYGVYWFFIALGLVLGIMLLFQADIREFTSAGMWFGAAGTLLSVVFMLFSGKTYADDTHEESEIKLLSLRETLIHNAEETAFVGTWVFVAYTIYELSVFALGGGSYAAGESLMSEMMTAAGPAAVLAGALVGLIPGCGPQVIFVALFAKGLIPFAALLANAVSQDGDALFPILAIDRKTGFYATLITTVPALIFGFAVYYLETNFNLFGVF